MSDIRMAIDILISRLHAWRNVWGTCMSYAANTQLRSIIKEMEAAILTAPQQAPQPETVADTPSGVAVAIYTGEEIHRNVAATTYSGMRDLKYVLLHDYNKLQNIRENTYERADSWRKVFDKLKAHNDDFYCGHGTGAELALKEIGRLQAADKELKTLKAVQNTPITLADIQRFKDAEKAVQYTHTAPPETSEPSAPQTPLSNLRAAAQRYGDSNDVAYLQESIKVTAIRDYITTTKCPLYRVLRLWNSLVCG